MVIRNEGNIYNQKMNQWDYCKILQSQVSGMDAVSVKVVPSTLCGTLTGQHSEQHLVQFLTKQLHLQSVSSSLILLSDLDGEGPISAGSQADIQPCFWISKVESKGESRPSWILFRRNEGKKCLI